MRKYRRCLCFILSILIFLSCAMSGSANSPMVKRMHGDADGDGKITTTDARLVLEGCVGKRYVDPQRLDVDWDGEVTTTDARILLQYCVGKRTYSCIGQMQEWVYPEGETPYVKKPKMYWSGKN